MVWTALTGISGDSNQNISTFKARGYLRLDSGDAILRCVLNDGELAMLPTYIVGRHITSGALMPVLETMVDERTPIHAVWRQKNHRLPKIEAFPDFLRQLYGDTPYWDIVTIENKGGHAGIKITRPCPVDDQIEKTSP